LASAETKVNTTERAQPIDPRSNTTELTPYQLPSDALPRPKTGTNVKFFFAQS